MATNLLNQLLTKDTIAQLAKDTKADEGQVESLLRENSVLDGEVSGLLNFVHDWWVSFTWGEILGIPQ